MLFTSILQNYSVTFYFNIKNLIIEKNILLLNYIICALLLVNYSITTQFI